MILLTVLFVCRLLSVQKKEATEAAQKREGNFTFIVWAKIDVICVEYEKNPLNI